VIALNHDGLKAVSLRCIGKVVRAERIEADHIEDVPNYQVAATLERYEFVRER
jgi:hypothetical protein